MTFPTVTVTVNLTDIMGVPCAGTRLTAKLDQNDSYTGGIVISKPLTETTDNSGVATFELFPNHPTTGLGTTGSTYSFSASVSGGKSFRAEAQIPNSDCNLQDVMDRDAVPSLSAAQTAQANAQSYAAQAAAVVNGADFQTVLGIADDIAALGPVAASVSTVAGHIANVDTVAGISVDVDAVAAIAAQVTTVGGDHAAINTLAGISSDISDVSGNAANVNTVAESIADINAVAADLPQVMTVAARFVIDAEDGSIDVLQQADGSVYGKLTNPNDVGYDVVLVVGQSNSEGRGDPIDTTNYDAADPAVWQYASAGTYANNVIVGVDPLYHVGGQISGKIGHATAFARLYARTIPRNRKVLLVPCALGGTGFDDGGATVGTWDQTIDAPSSGLNLARFAVAQANAAIALSSKNRIVAILWHQGEQDALKSRTQSAYETLLSSLITYFRTNITGATNVPFVIGAMLPEGVDVTATEVPIQAAHVHMQSLVLRTGFWYGPRGYVASTLHYNAAGQRINGGRAYDAFVRARANVLGTNPVAVTTATASQSGTSVVATWPQSAGRVTGYDVQVQVNGGAWTDITHTTVDITETSASGHAVGEVVAVRVRAVNEAGVSAWTTSGTYTMLDVPAQPTSLTSSVASGTHITLTWAAAARATSYLVEYKLHSSGTWLTASTVTVLTADVSGLTTSTSYDFRVTAVGVAGSGTASSTYTVSTTTLPCILDDVGVAAWAAFGLRKLRSAYAGNCIKVRRSSDSTTLDVGFSGNNLDTAAITTFIGASDGFVVTWYDQSGNARNLTQATTTAQAKLATAGVLNAINGAPYANFNGSTHKYSDTTVGLYAAGAATAAVVAKSAASNTAQAMLAGETGASANTVYGLINEIQGTHTLQLFIRDDVNTVLVSKTNTSLALITTPHSMVTVDTGSAVTPHVDSNSLNATTYSRDGHALTPTTRNLGFLNTAFWGGDFAERIAWDSALSDAQVTTVQANQKTYYGTP